MNSKDARKLYSGYLEGELSADEDEALRRHFAGAPESLEDYRLFEATVAIVRALPKEEAPEEMTAAIMRRVRDHREHPGIATHAPLFRRSRWREALPLAAMLALGFVSVFLVLALSGVTPLGRIGSNDAIVQGAPGSESAPRAASDEAVREALERTRLDRPLQQVGTGTETPSIVF